jgi:hypothetical protein
MKIRMNEVKRSYRCICSNVIKDPSQDEWEETEVRRWTNWRQVQSSQESTGVQRRARTLGLPDRLGTGRISAVWNRKGYHRRMDRGWDRKVRDFLVIPVREHLSVPPCKRECYTATSHTSNGGRNVTLTSLPLLSANMFRNSIVFENFGSPCIVSCSVRNRVSSTRKGTRNDRSAD